MLKKLLLFAAFVLLILSAWGDSLVNKLRKGDIVFHTSRSSQSVAIQKATHSKYSHMGIVFFRAGAPYVYEAIKTVQYTPWKKWSSRGEGGHCVVKRLKDAERILTTEAVAKLRQVATKLRGRPYDLTFEWSDERIYCSELVWKIYDRGLGLHIGRLQKLSEFDLSDPIVKAKLIERYSMAIPMEETVIYPGEMYTFDGLTIVAEH
ncbi:MAG: YiiX family permuted papain-like enzyme [Candidatus Aminicenantes bacterium]|nr:YiiX family permuted papain-like enzyme [Candidatus Aminicenantes bacterium]